MPIYLYKNWWLHFLSFPYLFLPSVIRLVFHAFPIFRSFFSYHRLASRSLPLLLKSNLPRLLPISVFPSFPSLLQFPFSGLLSLPHSVFSPSSVLLFISVACLAFYSSSLSLYPLVTPVLLLNSSYLPPSLHLPLYHL